VLKYFIMKIQYVILLSLAFCFGLVNADGSHQHDHPHVTSGADVPPADYSVPKSAAVVNSAVPVTSYSAPSSPAATYAAAPAVGYGYQLPSAYEFYPAPTEKYKSKKDKWVDFYNAKVEKLDAMQGKLADKFFDKWGKKSKYPTQSYAVPQVSYDDGTGASYGHSAVKYVFLPLSFAKNKDYKGTKGYVSDYTGAGYGDVNVKETGYAQQAVPTQYVYLPMAFAKNKDYKGSKGYVRNYDAGASDVEVVPDTLEAPAPQPSYGVPEPVYNAPQPTYGAPVPSYSAQAAPITKSNSVHTVHKRAIRAVPHIVYY
jgi:hypothetical protein